MGARTKDRGVVKREPDINGRTMSAVTATISVVSADSEPAMLACVGVAQTAISVAGFHAGFLRARDEVGARVSFIVKAVYDIGACRRGISG